MRSQVDSHPNNPREITPENYQRLEKSVESGLGKSLVCNLRTAENGFPEEECGKHKMLGGHQRLKILDDKNGYDPSNRDSDYEILFDIHETNCVGEIEWIIKLNNDRLMGVYVMAEVTALLSIENVNVESTGFDMSFLPGSGDPDVVNLDEKDDTKQRSKPPSTADMVPCTQVEKEKGEDSAESDEEDSDSDESEDDSYEDVDDQEDDEMSVYMVIQFDSHESKKMFCDRAGLNDELEYYDGEQISNRIPSFDLSGNFHSPAK